MTSSEISRIESLLKAFDLPTLAPEDMNYETFITHMKHDKKVASGKINYIIPEGLGKAIVTSDVDEKLLKDLLD